MKYTAALRSLHSCLLLQAPNSTDNALQIPSTCRTTTTICTTGNAGSWLGASTYCEEEDYLDGSWQSVPFGTSTHLHVAHTHRMIHVGSRYAPVATQLPSAPATSGLLP
jgi:hypothetical protein